LADFGTVETINQLHTDIIVSNGINRAPEAIQGPGYGPVRVDKNDCWAVGCMGFQLFEGFHPFNNPDVDDLEVAIRQGAIRTLKIRMGI